MENHSADQTMILSMKISCCARCPKILRKKLQKMNGVESVAIDTENDLVFVTGKVNPTTLLNNVAKLGKAVQLQPTDEHNYTRHDNNFAARKTRKMHKNCCCEDGRHVHKQKSEEEHKCETYALPTVDERVCRDIFCKTHTFLHKIKHTVPPEKTYPFGLGWLPLYGGVGPYGSSYGGGSYPHQARYRNEPHPYEYAPQPRLGPHHPYGFQYRQ